VIPLRLATPDRLLRRFCRSGDPHALGALFDHVAPELLRVARWLTGHGADADDLLQRTFLAVIEQRSSYDPRRRALPWLLGILGNHARKLHEQRARPPAGLPMTRERDPAELAADRELREAIADLRQSLPTPYLAVLDLHLGEGLEPKAIAARLGRPAGTVRTQLMRGLTLLRQRLPSGFALGAAPLALTDAPALAATKRAVLAAAERVAPTAAATTSFTLATKLAVVLPVLTLVVAVAAYAVWSRPLETARAASSTVASAPPVTNTATTPSPAAPPQRALLADAPTIAGGTRLQLEVRWQDDDTPASGVGLFLDSHPRSLLHCTTATTDQAGRATFDQLTPGRYMVEGSHIEGNATLELAAGESRSVRLRATRRHRARGRVVDMQDAPVADAEIWMTCSTTNGYAVARSEARGEFELPLSGGAYLHARKYGHVPSHSLSVHEHAGDPAQLVLRLRGPATQLRGVVRDSAGRPIPRAVVLLGPLGLASVASGDPTVFLITPSPERLQTDADGAFVSRQVAVGQLHIRTWAVGYGPNLQMPTLTADRVNEVAITLAAGATVRGTVRDAEGVVLAGAAVRLGDQTDFPQALAFADAAGRYELANLPAGAQRLVAAHGAARASATLTLTAGSTTAWEPTVGGSGDRVAGRVLGPEGAPFAAQVGVAPRNRSSIRNWVTTDAEGRFEVAGIDDRTCELHIARDGATLLELRDVVTGRTDLEVRIAAEDVPSARLHGRIVDPLGQPARGSVAISRPESQPFAVQPLDASGSFAFPLLSARTFEVTASLEGFGLQRLGELTLQPRDDRRIELALQVPGDVEFTVLDAAGQPVSTEHVILFTGGGATLEGCAIEAGRGTRRTLQPGQYHVQALVASPELFAANFTVRSGATTRVEVRGRPAPRVQLTFRDPDAVPGLRVTVRANDATGQLAGYLQTFPQNTLPLTQQRQFAPGDYTIACRTSDGRTMQTTLTVGSADQALTIDLPSRR
jgi:RNA polymerase sigma factor (sigma-70 family)